MKRHLYPAIRIVSLVALVLMTLGVVFLYGESQEVGYSHDQYIKTTEDGKAATRANYAKMVEADKAFARADHAGCKIE